jgi:membrane protease YdiL (CAAX protease family)
MLWKEPWEPEAVLALVGGIVAAFFFGDFAAALLQRASVAGFRTDLSGGSVLLATLSFQGATLALGTGFLKSQNLSWRDALGATGWKRCLGLALAVLAVTVPVMFGLKYISELVLRHFHWRVEDQMAVTMILSAKPWVRAYLVFFALVLAPMGEEFFFRGLLYSMGKSWGWPKTGWIGSSLLFALFHLNAPAFLPLFVLALALTWLYERTGGLLAPILAHGLFNLANLTLLLFG